MNRVSARVQHDVECAGPYGNLHSCLTIDMENLVKAEIEEFFPGLVDYRLITHEVMGMGDFKYEVRRHCLSAARRRAEGEFANWPLLNSRKTSPKPCDVAFSDEDSGN
jgi:hypothetical protein